jgi:hypothetical protein
MVRVSEKRSMRIPPVKIDKGLLVSVGEILKAECSEHSIFSFALYADSKDIETEDSKEFNEIEIPPDTYAIEMTATAYAAKSLVEEEPWENPIEIEIDIRKPKNSQIRVRGEKRSWVAGVSDSIVKAFERKRLGYRHIASNEVTRSVMAVISSVLLTYVSGFALSLFHVEALYLLMFIASFFYFMTLILKRFFDRVFPYFEIDNEEFLPRKVRKWALLLLWSSGIIPAIIFKILGL